jgi:hypothetical protein
VPPIEQFNARAQEVRTFLRSLQDLERGYRLPGRGFYAGSRALAASRATAFLMLYNCVEHGVREVVVRLRTDIRDSGAGLHELRDFWQSEIIKDHFLEPLQQGTNHEAHLRLVRDFLPGRVVWPSRIDLLPFAGNIDHKRLFSFVKSIDHRLVVPKAALGGNDLELIRRTRNELAHGDESFSNVGANYTTEDIIAIHDRVRTFMRAFIKAIEAYRSARAYIR